MKVKESEGNLLRGDLCNRHINKTLNSGDRQIMEICQLKH